MRLPLVHEFFGLNDANHTLFLFVVIDLCQDSVKSLMFALGNFMTSCCRSGGHCLYYLVNPFVRLSDAFWGLLGALSVFDSSGTDDLLTLYKMILYKKI